MDAEKPYAVWAATAGFGVRGLVCAFGRRLVAVERKRRVQVFSASRFRLRFAMTRQGTRPGFGDKSPKR